MTVVMRVTSSQLLVPLTKKDVTLKEGCAAGHKTLTIFSTGQETVVALHLG